MRRGEVWWATLPDPAGTRPVVLLSRDRAIEVRNAVIVAAVSRTVRGIPTEVPLGKKDGMPRKCAVNTDVLFTVPKDFLRERMAVLACVSARGDPRPPRLRP